MSKKPDTAAALAGILRAKRGDDSPADAPSDAAPLAEAAEPAPPSPAPVDASPPAEAAKPKPSARGKKTEPTPGKRHHPDYCQANAYVPRKLRRAVDRALLDIDGLDYSTLVEDLLRKWLKARGVSE
jgi:hypothetical protein